MSEKDLKKAEAAEEKQALQAKKSQEREDKAREKLRQKSMKKKSSGGLFGFGKSKAFAFHPDKTS